jgi:hypothetical protein
LLEIAAGVCRAWHLAQPLNRYYHVTTMNTQDADPQELLTLAESTLEQTAQELQDIVGELASRLRPFPSFLNMVSVQAVELEPTLRPGVDRGCVVVTPDGEICRLDLMGIPGVAGVADAGQVEQFLELDLPAEEYIVYAATAVRLLVQELRRRGG